MDRQRTLLNLGQKMQAATEAEDWTRLAAINTLLATALPTMAAQGAWDSAERAALSALHRLHLEAARRCELASAEVARKLADLQVNKEGWFAYARDSEYAGHAEYAEHAENGTQA